MWIQRLRSSPPASSRTTRVAGSSESRIATTQPAEPAPTTTKSASIVSADADIVLPFLPFPRGTLTRHALRVDLSRAAGEEKSPSLACCAHFRFGAECRHHFLGETAQVIARCATAVQQDVLHAHVAQLLDLSRDLVGVAVECALLARRAGVGECHDAGGVVAVRSLRDRMQPPLRGDAAIECGLLLGAVAR